MRIPLEFADILSERAKPFLHKKNKPMNGDVGGYRKMDGAIHPSFCKEIMLILESEMKPHLHKIDMRLPTDAKSMYNFKYKTGTSPLGWQSSSAYLNYSDPESYSKVYLGVQQAVYDTFYATGIPSLFHSDSWNEWMCNFLGEDESAFADRSRAIQVSRYVEGDNIGLHNDYYGNRKQADWFIDAHISFCHEVAHQYMLFGVDSLSNSTCVSKMGSIGLYKLPLWHFVTPMVAKRGKSSEAYRWLIILDRWYK
jgi:hypothetical protein